MSGNYRPDRLRNAETNPCLKEADLTQGCLDRYDYDGEKCKIFFDNYNKCKEFWNQIKKKRAALGVKPNMPGEKERQEILAGLKNK